MKFKVKSIYRILRVVLMISGSLFLVSCILAFTTLPYYAWHWLGTHEGTIRSKPSVIVLMGGAGMPSEDGLIRSYFAARLAAHYPESAIVIAIPGDTTDSLSAPKLYQQELLMRGIQKNRIHFESMGHNTRQQSMFIAESGICSKDTSVLAIVTSPEHMMRSILCFEKVGFRHVEGLPAFETSIPDNELQFNDADLKGNKAVPGIGKNKQFRYQFWNHLHYEILVCREYFALAYYKVRAWI